MPAYPDNPLISLILACYNQERFVGEAVDGVLSQTYSPLEVLIVDDGSTDATATAIETKLGEHPKRSNIHFVRNGKNMGTRNSVQRALSMTTGDFVTIACGDDVLLPDMIAEVAKVWRAEQVSLVTTNAVYIDENSNLLHRTYRDPDMPADDSFETIARDGVNACCFGPCISFERELHKEFGWPPAHLECVDIIYPFYAHLLKGERFLSKPLFKYRVHSANTSLSLIAERSSDELERLLVQERDFSLRLNHAIFMYEELDRLRSEKPKRYSDLADRTFPLISIQIVETAKKLIRAQRRLVQLREETSAALHTEIENAVA